MNPATILTVLALAYFLQGLSPWSDIWCETLDAINPGFFAGEGRISPPPYYDPPAWEIVPENAKETP